MYHNSPIVLPYEEIADSIEVHVSEDNSVYITLHTPGVSVELQDGTDLVYGNRVQYISFSTTEWNRRFANGNGLTLKIDDTADGTNPGKLIKHIYYYPSLDNHKAVCLYEAEDIKNIRNDGVSILPRLTLNYYTLFAAILVIAGGICCIILRKNLRRVYICLKITMIPFSYFLCSQLILWNKDDIYNAVYYFSGILMASFVLYLIAFWIVDFVRFSVKKARCNQ